jgi:hypothetical protein
MAPSALVLVLLGLLRPSVSVLLEGLEAVDQGRVSVAGVARDAPGVAASGSTHIELPPVAVRTEWFALARRGVPAGEPVAVLRLVRVDGAAETLLERDLVFREEGWRIHHTERLAGTVRRLVWRELGPGGALCTVCDWDLAAADGGLSLQEIGYGWERPTHGRRTAAAPWIGPLEALEAARAGALEGLGPVTPVAPAGVAEGPAALSVEAGRLLTFELPGRLVATPLEAREFARLVERWGHRPAPHHPFVEAALRRDRNLRILAGLEP